MIIELLKIKVAPEYREIYIQKDAEIWTAALAKYPGFLAKEIWINPKDYTEVILVIRWASREQWKSIPTQVLDEIENQFFQQMGDTYQMLEVTEYQVKKLPQQMGNG